MLLARILAVSVLCATAALAPATASADELIVDNSSPNVQVVGPWSPATVTSGFNGGDYLTRPGSSGDATVYWPFPATATPGTYEVFARWTSGGNRASNALYWISSDPVPTPRRATSAPTAPAGNPSARSASRLASRKG